jgi:O-acetyl-ADP-ribose deacetylase (regulator of RNase III)
MITQERILNICDKVPALEELYNVQVRHYSIKEHTINVLNQFEKYFSNSFSEIEIEVFRLFLLLHDIGKPIAYKKGNRDNQYSETIRIISENKQNLNLSDNDFLLFKALLGADSLGLYMQNKISLDDTYFKIIEQSNLSKLDVKSFFYLLSVYYQCDIASYTKDAGGLKYLEYLFGYQNGLKIYDESSRLLKYSFTYHTRYIALLNKITGILAVENNSLAMHIPSNLEFINGNIFNSKAQTIVNTINCVGVMGKGIALVFKLRYPLMFDIYKKHCEEKHIGIGKLWLYNQQPNTPWVLNFPTKYHWKYPSKMEYIEKGLVKFSETYKDKSITSIAFPLLGTHNGGLEREEVKLLMIKYLSKCAIPIEVYDYDPSAPDDLFETFKKNWKKLSQQEIKATTGIQPQYIRKINEVLENPEVYSMVTLVSYDGIGEKTLQKAFNFAMNYKQETLF